MKNSATSRTNTTLDLFLRAQIQILAFCLLVLPSWALAFDESKVLDMTYPFDESTIYWPTAKPFTLEKVAAGMTKGGYWYAANNMSLAEHGGTHLDAPIHFAKGCWTTDEVPLQKLMGPAAVIDIRSEAAKDPDYRLRVEDLFNWEKSHGRIPEGALVLVYTGWGRYWPDKKKYLGTDKRGDVANLRFPGISREAAEFLVKEREIDAVGVDTASLDYGRSKDFIAHRILLGANKPGLENIANLDRLPPMGATIVALPMKIKGGSGGPVRLIAILP